MARPSRARAEETNSRLPGLSSMMTSDTSLAELWSSMTQVNVELRNILNGLVNWITRWTLVDEMDADERDRRWWASRTPRWLRVVARRWRTWSQDCAMSR